MARRPDGTPFSSSTRQHEAIEASTRLQSPTPLDVQTGGDHYKKLKIQPAYYNWANRIPFIEGCCIKYLTRWRDKGGVEDLKKSKHLHEMLIYFETTPLELVPQSKLDELERACEQAHADFRDSNQGSHLG